MCRRSLLSAVFFAVAVGSPIFAGHRDVGYICDRRCSASSSVYLPRLSRLNSVQPTGFEMYARHEEHMQPSYQLVVAACFTNSQSAAQS